MENLKGFKEEVTREIAWNGRHGMTIDFNADPNDDDCLDPVEPLWLKVVDVHADEDGSPDQAVDRFVKRLRDAGWDSVLIDVWDENTRRSYFHGWVQID